MLGDLRPAHAGERRQEVRRAVRAEDGDRPGEPGRTGAELFEAGDEPAAARFGAEAAQEGGGARDGFEHPVAGLGEQFDRLVRVPGGHRPQFAAERFVRVAAQRVPGERRGGAEREGVQAQGHDGAVGERGEEGRHAGAPRPLRQGPVGQDDEGGQPAVPPDPGEGVEPRQGFGVGPMRVVHQQHRRPVPQPVREPPQELGQAVPHTLRVGGSGRRRRRRGQAERGGQQVEVAAAEEAYVLLVEAVERGLEQLAGDVERDRGEGLAAPGRQDGAPVACGAVDLVEEGRLADPRLSPVDEDAAARRAALRRPGDEFVDGVGGRGQFRIAFEEPAVGPVRDGGHERRDGRRLFGIRRHR